VAVVLAVWLSAPVAPRLRTPRIVAALLLFGFGLVVAATLVPDAGGMRGEASDGVCDLSRIGLAPLDELTRVSLTSLNVLLFVPLGLAVGLLPPTRTAAVVTVAAVLLTFVVEGIQLVVAGLGRGCQSADVFDNLLGLAIGMAIGAVVRVLASRVPGPRA
jgi:VanZ family protein